MREVTANAGVYPDAIFCTQGVRVDRERTDIPFRVAPRYQGLWAEEAQPIGPGQRAPARMAEPDGARRVEIGIVDTGIAQGQYASPDLDESVLERWRFDSESGDPPDVDGNGRIESPAGHGTFVGGAIRLIEPNVRLHVLRAVGRQGAVSDSVLAERIGALVDALATMGIELDILNLSLGGWTHDDYQPLMTGERLARLPSRTLVVAAAGNLDSRRPFWPAAMERVVAVGAMISDGDTWARAEYSNYGGWVDAVAWDGGTRVPGKLSTGSQTSTFYANFPPGARRPEFNGWAHWRGTSFTAPKIAGRIAQIMVRDNLRTAEEAWQRLREACAGDPLPDFPNAVLVGEEISVKQAPKPKRPTPHDGPLKA
jgi:hypothetical protein